jgi:GNAT superfamily N-acetyltransferase
LKWHEPRSPGCRRSLLPEQCAGPHRATGPYRCPVVVLGRLAVHSEFHGRGIGTALLRDAVLRTVQAAEIAGIRAILVHAISIAAKRFYEKYGFIASPVHPLTVMIPVAEAMKILGK